MCAKIAYVVNFARKSDNTDQKSVIFDLGASFLLESSNFWQTTWEPYSKSTMNFWTETVHEIVHYSCTRSVPWCTMEIVQFKAHQWVSHTRFTLWYWHIQFSTPYKRDLTVSKIWKVRNWVPSALYNAIVTLCHDGFVSWRLCVLTTFVFLVWELHFSWNHLIFGIPHENPIHKLLWTFRQKKCTKSCTFRASVPYLDAR